MEGRRVAEVVECTACGEEIGRGPAGLGVVAHWNMHRREYRAACDVKGRPSKQEIREWLNDGGGFDRTVAVEDDQARLTRWADSPGEADA